ncbi:MAG: OsmC family protein [Gemmatimonadota bacterium]|jgi:uncharacterized OsmC-like protein
MDLISVARRSGLAFDVRVRDRVVSCDMAPGDGGEGDGFSPVELLAGCVGACMAMAVQSWCDNCRGEGGDVSASVTFELLSDPKRVGTVVIDLEVPPEVPEDRRAALHRVIETCPIRETLKRPPEVDVEIVFNSEG